ncbi:MAG: Crp/Fnr family transcriptional regulator [Bradymonadia bacterium]
MSTHSEAEQGAFSRAVGSIMQGVYRITRTRQGAAPVIDEPPEGSQANLALSALQRFATHPTASGLARSIQLLAMLDGFPRVRSRGLEWVGGMAVALGEKELACQIHAEGMQIGDALGDPEIEARHLAAITAHAPSPAWKRFADRNAPRALIRASTPLTQVTAHPLFQHISHDLKARLADEIEALSYQAGEHLAVAGNPATALYILRSGQVAVWAPFQKHRRFVCYRSEGDVIGEMGWLSVDRDRTADCVAMSPIEAWKVPYSLLDELQSEQGGQQMSSMLQWLYLERRVQSLLTMTLALPSNPQSGTPRLGALSLSEAVQTVVSDPRNYTPRFIDGETLLKENDTLEGVFAILDGSVSVQIDIGGGEHIEGIRTARHDHPILLSGSGQQESSMLGCTVKGCGSGYAIYIPPTVPIRALHAEQTSALLMSSRPMERAWR